MQFRKRGTRCSQTDDKPNVCFVALNAYNLLSGREDIHHVGGAEVQQLQIASWLVGKGYKISFVTLDHGQPDGIEINGIKVFKAYAKRDGIPGLRFVYPRWSGLWEAMTRANADVYYQRGPECETGQVALWCHLHRRKFIFAAANAASCDPRLLALESWPDRALYHMGVRLAHAVTAQTATQRALFRQNMGIGATLIRNCGGKRTSAISGKSPVVLQSGSFRVLWIGRNSRVKRFEWLLDIAKQCPQITFDVVGVSNTGCGYAAFLMERAAGIPNVKMHGYMPYAKVVEYYQDCHALCCTSESEGFPNTFLEAWATGTPVVSTFDPDGVIAANGMGWVALDVAGMVACLKRIGRSPEAFAKASKAAKQYYLTHHTPEACMPLLEQLLARVTRYATRQV